MPAEADVERLVDHAFAPQPLVDAELVHQVDGALLQHAGAHATLDVVAAARLQHDAIDAGAMQQMREKQSGRPRADDGDLCVHFLSRPSTRNWRGADAFFKGQFGVPLGQSRDRAIGTAAPSVAHHGRCVGEA